MRISNHMSYFHDGEIIEIKHIKNNIEILMKSAEIDPSDISEDIPLSTNHCLRGKLHIEGIQSIYLNDDKFSGTFEKLYEDNDLLHLKIEKNTVFLEIGWRGPKSFQNDFSALVIKADKIWWENHPELYDPFC
jgi:hypothetical protein